ncbi:MAG: hypothetical protein AAB361_01120 [Patescibacteria group bacterium]
MAVIFYISTLFITISTSIFEGIYSLDILQQPMTRGNEVIASVVLHGWAIVRDFANMFIVLGFVVIGIATILRIREYEAQKLLPKLIIVALLINFSLLICGIVIDATNITMRYFTQISRPTTIIQTYQSLIASDEVSKVIENEVKKAGKAELKKIEAYVLGYGGVSVLFTIVAMIFFVYGILLLFRYVALICLVILSPLAFVCSVFPATRQIYEKWKSQFIQWAIIGIPTAFFVYLGTFLLVSMKNANLLASGPGSPVNPAGVSLAFWIPTAFMLFAYSLIFQISAIGASAALGLATGAMGFAVGASKWGGKKLAVAGGRMADKASGGLFSQGSASTRDAILELGEKIGAVKAGTVADRKQKRLNEAMGGWEKQYGDNPEDNRKLAEKLTARMTSGKDKAAIATILAKRKALDYIPKDRQEAAAANAVAFGASKETFLKDRPDLMTSITDEGARQKLIEEERARLEQYYLDTGLSPKPIKPFVEKDLAKYKKTGLSVAAIENKKREMAKEKEQERKLDYIAPTDADIIKKAKEDYTPTTAEVSSMKAYLDNKKPSGVPLTTDKQATLELKARYKPDTTTIIKTREKLTTERAKEKTYDFKYPDRTGARQDLIDKEAKRLRDVVKLSGSNLDAEIKKYSNGLTPKDVELHFEELKTEKEAEAIKKLGPSKLREIHKSQIDANLVEHSNYRTFSRAALEFTPEQKDKYKTLVPDLIDRKRLAVRPPSTYTGTADDWKKLTPSQRADLYITMTPVQIATHKSSFTNEEKKKIRDLNNKIKTIQNPSF